MRKGFTIIELMTSVSIFLVIMTISMGSIIGIFDANRKARSLKTALTQLNFVVESMSKEIRFGSNFHCGTSGTLTNPQNCSAGDNYFTFLSSLGQQITYSEHAGIIEKKINNGPNIPMTGSDIILDEVTFYTFGAGLDLQQPKVLIKIKTHSGIDKGRTDFTLQTMISQRLPDA